MRFFASFDFVDRRLQSLLTHDDYLTSLTQRVAGVVHDPKLHDSLSARLADAVYAPHRLKDLGKLETLWQRLTLAVTQDAFPDIADAAYAHTLQHCEPPLLTIT